MVGQKSNAIHENMNNLHNNYKEITAKMAGAKTLDELLRSSIEGLQANIEADSIDVVLQPVDGPFLGNTQTNVKKNRNNGHN
jgi:hypothetical protein